MNSDDPVKKRREVFGDCALIEIIHLHDCLRGALSQLKEDVNILASKIEDNPLHLERRVSGRFKVIWSVFKSHSSAEDEFIWPALRNKNKGIGEVKQDGVDQHEYEEDHADEERMFSEMDSLLSKLREAIIQKTKQVSEHATELVNKTKKLSHHLMNHLEKEETQCLPLVVEHLSKEEIHDLVGQIMGKRSADTIAQIMTMAVQSLDQQDRDEMVKYMKESMAGTFFDRWLTMSGWMSNNAEERKRPAEEPPVDNKRIRIEDEEDIADSSAVAIAKHSTDSASGATSQQELEKLIRAVATNPTMSAEQKNVTIQGLRDSVWKSNQRLRDQISTEPIRVNAIQQDIPTFPSHHANTPSGEQASSTSRLRRNTPPTAYFKKSGGKVDKIWSNEKPGSPVPQDVPLFSAEELAPTYHDGAAGTVLGCPHYSRACKMRHPKSGRLYTCRLCCDQQRELPLREPDEPLDRYAVSEVMCMKCNALQPAEDRCMNSECEAHGKPFSKYFCRICHLYDDGQRPIFHCPYCNTCRLGKGLGIDFRHCMRCNACVSLADDDHHCIPQKLQGDCPICNESLFQSTQPLKGLKCGHVMHLQCFTDYRRGRSYTCPLCMKSMEDMKDYFALLDAAIRMQPMPPAYLSTMSNIYCQDCGKTGQTQYHFVGQKCPHCQSYNTREMGRFHNSPR